MGCSPWGHKESDTTAETLHTHTHTSNNISPLSGENNSVAFNPKIQKLLPKILLGMPGNSLQWLRCTNTARVSHLQTCILTLQSPR